MAMDGEGEQNSNQDELAETITNAVLIPSTKETVISTLCHFTLVCFYICVHLYDASVFAEHEAVWYRGGGSYGGRWQALTYILLWVEFVYFVFALIIDLLPCGSAIKVAWFHKYRDWMFTTLVLPMALYVSSTYWSVCSYDRELVHPIALSQHVPDLLNHLWHTTNLLCVVIELLLVFHSFSNVGPYTTGFWAFSYAMWQAWVYRTSGHWPYQFMHHVPFLPLFVTANVLLCPVLYYLGKAMCNLRWYERHRLLEAQDMNW